MWWGIGVPAFALCAVALGLAGLVLPDGFPFALVVTSALLGLALTFARCLLCAALAPERPPSRTWQVACGWVAELGVVLLAVAIASRVEGGGS